MSFGFGVLRLSPRDFWAMTPREIHMAMSPFRDRRVSTIERGDLATLMRSFPDEANE